MAFIPEKLQRMAKAVGDSILLRGATAGGAVTVAYTDPVTFTVSVGGTAKSIIKFVMWDATTPDGLDGIGLTQRVYSPTKAQVLFDADDTFSDGAEIQARILFELSKLGCKIEIYAHATVAAGNIASANLKSTLDSLQYPLLATV